MPSVLVVSAMLLGENKPLSRARQASVSVRPLFQDSHHVLSSSSHQLFHELLLVCSIDPHGLRGSNIVQLRLMPLPKVGHLRCLPCLELRVQVRVPTTIELRHLL